MRIFISAVTSEFGKVREKLASDLRARGHEVAVQSDFTQGGHAETLLERLHDYVRECDAVICILGKRSGLSPPPPAAADFSHMLPSSVAQASYTQWERIFAHHYRRLLYSFVVSDRYKPDNDEPFGSDKLQDDFVQALRDRGVNLTEFSEDSELRINVLREPALSPGHGPKPVVLPYPSLGPLFKGRDGFMLRLHESLSGDGKTAITARQALYGLGGIGKTRVTVEYAWTHQDDYTALLFVVAETPEVLRANLAALTKSLVPQADTADDNVRLQAVLDWLASNPGWLLILDNVDSKAAMTAVEDLLKELRGGRVLVTSRLSDFSGNFTPLSLDVLSIDDAGSFLLERTGGRRRGASDDEAKAKEIAKEVDGLALALEQAGAYIAKRRLTFDGYLKQWRSTQHDDVLKWFDVTVTGYPKAVAVTWQTSVMQLTENGRHLLEILAFLAPGKIPEFLLDKNDARGEAERLRDALDDLAAFSLVTRDAEGPFFLVHRLVQDVTRRSLTASKRNQRVLEGLNWISAAFPEDLHDVGQWPRAEALAPHAEALVAYGVNCGIPKPTTKLMNELGMLLMAKALHHQAEPLFRTALAVDESTLGPEHPNVAIDLITTAHLLIGTSRPDEAEPLIRRAIEIDTSTYGSDHIEVAKDAKLLAEVLRTRNKFADAEREMRRALRIAEERLETDDPGLTSFLANLASLLADTGRPDEAEQLMVRALRIDEKYFGPNHPNAARHLSNLGVLLRSTNRPFEAESSYRRALKIEEDSFEPDHPALASTLSNLAALLLATSRHEEGERMMRRAALILAKFYRRTGHHHPSFETVISNYGGILAERGKSEAEIEAAFQQLKREAS